MRKYHRANKNDRTVAFKFSTRRIVASLTTESLISRRNLLETADTNYLDYSLGKVKQSKAKHILHSPHLQNRGLLCVPLAHTQKVCPACYSLPSSIGHAALITHHYSRVGRVRRVRLYTVQAGARALVYIPTQLRYSMGEGRVGLVDENSKSMVMQGTYPYSVHTYKYAEDTVHRIAIRKLKCGAVRCGAVPCQRLLITYLTFPYICILTYPPYISPSPSSLLLFP
jgi:hypothetical protein